VGDPFQALQLALAFGQELGLHLRVAGGRALQEGVKVLERRDRRAEFVGGIGIVAEDGCVHVVVPLRFVNKRAGQVEGLPTGVGQEHAEPLRGEAVLQASRDGPLVAGEYTRFNDQDALSSHRLQTRSQASRHPRSLGLGGRSARQGFGNGSQAFALCDSPLDIQRVGLGPNQADKVANVDFSQHIGG